MTLHDKMSLIVDCIEQHLPFPMSYCLKKLYPVFQKLWNVKHIPCTNTKAEKITLKWCMFFQLLVVIIRVSNCLWYLKLFMKIVRTGPHTGHHIFRIIIWEKKSFQFKKWKQNLQSNILYKKTFTMYETDRWYPIVDCWKNKNYDGLEPPTIET